MIELIKKHPLISVFALYGHIFVVLLILRADDPVGVSMTICGLVMFGIAIYGASQGKGHL